MRIRGSLTWLFAAGLALAACFKTNQPEVIGGETNWLKACSDQAGCGTGSCVCGVCTLECGGTSMCGGAFAGNCVATTSTLGASACSGAAQVPTGLCLPDCTGDAECGAGFACRDTVCVTESIAARFDVERQLPAAQDEGSCRRAVMGCQEAGMCQWASALALGASCSSPLAGAYEARCGSYDAIISAGIDSATYYYYGKDGALVGTHQEGLVSDPGCVAYDPSFVLPATCAPTSAPWSSGPCVAEAGGDDAGVNEIGAVDGGAGDANQRDTASTLCNCGSEELSLECVCAQLAGCETFEKALAEPSCPGTPVRPSLQQGCGYTQVTLGGGGSRMFVYQGADHTLVGAQFYVDVPFGTCARPVYRTALPDLQACGDYSTCDLCPSSDNPCQL